MWRRRTIRRQRLKYFEEKLTAKHRELESQRIFTEWKALVCGNQQSEAFLLSNALQYWLKQSKKHKSEQLKCDALKQWIDIKTLNQLWLRWYLRTMDEIEMNDKIAISDDFFGQKLQTQTMRIWKQYAEDNKKEKKLTKKLKKIHKKSLKRKAFSHWKSIHAERVYQSKTNQMALQFLMSRYLQSWNQQTKLTKYRKFNEYKARLFNTRSYFNTWLIEYEPFKIGFEYERQITLSIKPYIDSIQKRSYVHKQ